VSESQPTNTSTSPAVLTEVREAKQGKVGFITLNSPSTLNSLSLDMVRSVRTALDEWANDDDIAVVLLRGEGEKAFCAGGDVQELYKSATETPGGPCDYAETFFLEEYQLNYLIHRYSKPIVCIGNGIVMGGGLGLMAGASYRIATETTRIAMPEISIGLFPDVGGTWFLNKMPNALGIFFALTGAHINALDAKLTGLANHLMEARNIQDFESKLVLSSWHTDRPKNESNLQQLLATHTCSEAHISQFSPSEIAPFKTKLSAACQQTSLGEVIKAIAALAPESKWLKRANATLEKGSALSSLLIFEQLKRYRYAALDKIFEQELSLATRIVRYPEFTEGVRALLIDKDKSPKWKFEHFSGVSSELLETFFTAPWPHNPLSEHLANINNSIKQQ
jgi:enoyl-CoA hydratase/carnithine racemase